MRGARPADLDRAVEAEATSASASTELRPDDGPRPLQDGEVWAGDFHSQSYGNIPEDGMASSPKDGQNLDDRPREAGAQGPLGMLEALFQQNAELLQQNKSLHGRLDKLEDEASMRTVSLGSLGSQ